MDFHLFPGCKVNNAQKEVEMNHGYDEINENEMIKGLPFSTETDGVSSLVIPTPAESGELDSEPSIQRGSSGTGGSQEVLPIPQISAYEQIGNSETNVTYGISHIPPVYKRLNKVVNCVESRVYLNQMEQQNVSVSLLSSKPRLPTPELSQSSDISEQWISIFGNIIL